MNALTLHQQTETKHKRIAYIITVGVHIVLLLLLLWIALQPPNPPIEYGGMELSMRLGEPDMGGPSPTPTEELAQQAPQPVAEEQVATQDIEEAPSVKAQPEKLTKPQPVVAEKQPVEKPREVDKRSLFTKKTQSGQAGSGDGTTPGNEGNPDGIPDGSVDGNGLGDGKGGTGTGSGNTDGWGGFTLAGRSIVQRPQITDNSKETGKVVLRIVVDRNGHVLRAEPGQKGTTTSSSILWEKAKQGALQARFTPKPDGPAEQYGTMTINFRFKP